MTDLKPEPALPDDNGVVTPPWRRRRVILAAVVVIAAAAAAYSLLPWILPLAIDEGPLVQQAATESAILVWYTSRPAQCVLEVGAPPGVKRIPVESSGRRHLARLDGLTPATEYPYAIRSGDRELAAATLRTAGPPGQPIRFIVFGDSGKATREQYQLAAEIAARKPDFLLHTGDLVYPGGERRYFRERFFRPYRETIRCVPIWPSLGNHDVSEPEFGQPYLEVFELPGNGPAGLPPERSYWFSQGPACFVVIDSNLDEPTLREQVAPWLIEVFAASTAPWRFVVLHHPAYTVGPHGPTERVQTALVPAFERAGVDMVFSGHDHLYCRTHPLRSGEMVPPDEGIVYVVSGAGGARLYEAVPQPRRPGYVAAFHDQRHGFTEIELAARELRLRHILLGGAIVDSWTRTKPAPPSQQ